MSLPPVPPPRPVDTAKTLDWAAIEQRIEKRLGQERASLLVVQREFCEKLREPKSLTLRLEEAVQRQEQTPPRHFRMSQFDPQQTWQLMEFDTI